MLASDATCHLSSVTTHDGQHKKQRGIYAWHLRVTKDLVYIQITVLVYNKLLHLSNRFLVISPSLRPLL
jgi:hypothetical protein